MTWNRWRQRFNTDVATYVRPDERVIEIVSTQNRSLIWEKLWWVSLCVLFLIELTGFQAVLQALKVPIFVGLLATFAVMELFALTMTFRYFVVTDQRILVLRTSRFARQRRATLDKELPLRHTRPIPTRRWSSFKFQGSRCYVRFFFTPLGSRRLIR